MEKEKPWKRLRMDTYLSATIQAEKEFDLSQMVPRVIAKTNKRKLKESKFGKCKC